MGAEWPPQLGLHAFACAPLGSAPQSRPPDKSGQRRAHGLQRWAQVQVIIPSRHPIPRPQEWRFATRGRNRLTVKTDMISQFSCSPEIHTCTTIMQFGGSSKSPDNEGSTVTYRERHWAATEDLDFCIDSAGDSQGKGPTAPSLGLNFLICKIQSRCGLSAWNSSWHRNWNSEPFPWPPLSHMGSIQHSLVSTFTGF